MGAVSQPQPPPQPYGSGMPPATPGMAVAVGGAAGAAPLAGTTCYKCNAPLSVGQKFCGNCGANQDLKPGNIVCPRCGFSNPPSNKFCGGCGQTLSAPADIPKVRRCSRCQAVVPEGMKFCGSCGAPVVPASGASQQQASQQASQIQSAQPPVASSPSPPPQAPKRCVECKKEVPPDVKFCPHCGARVE